MDGPFKKKYFVYPEEPVMANRCEKCGHHFNPLEFDDHMNVCPKCAFHHRITAKQRIQILIDEDTFVELYADLQSKNPLSFPGYEEKIQSDQEKTGLQEAVVTGVGHIGGIACALAVMDSFFRMGSMGAVVGEKIFLLIEHARQLHLPLVICSASGGARMQEGVLSLMQMAKTSAALAHFQSEGNLFISFLTDPTTGGVSASFAMLGDYQIAEPGAMIGFAGRRVIEQTIRQKLPDDFQTAEFLLAHGQIDLVIHRHQTKQMIHKLFALHR